MEPSMGEWRRLDPSARGKFTPLQPSGAGVAAAPVDLRTTNNGSAQNETSIAVDPNNPDIVVGGFNDYNVGSGGLAGNGVVYSTDGGNTFTYHTTGVTGLPGFSNSNGDPALAFDTQGRVYYAFIGAAPGNTFTKSSGIFVARSDDGGANWNTATTVAANTFSSARVNFEDKEFIDVDRNASSPYRDRVYVSWTRFYEGFYPGTTDSGGGDIMFSSSSDGGQNWTAPIRLSAPADLAGNGGSSPGRSFVQGSEPEVGPDGSVYVVFKFTTYAVVRRSTDGGATFGAATFPFGTGDGTQTYDHDGIGNNGTQLPSWSFRTNAFPNIETHPTLAGQVYVVATDDPTDDATGDGGNIVFARSTNFGGAWGGAATLNDDGGGASQVFPWMAMNDAGIVEVIWYDARNASGGNTVDVYATCSGDGGATFSSNFRVTDQTFNPNTSQFSGNTFFGDYNGLAGGATDFHALWTDGRNGEQEIYYDRPACCDFDRNPPELTCPLDITIECTQNGGTPASDAQLTGFFAGVSATDDCDNSPTVTDNAPLLFPEGPTTVTFTAVDDSGNTSQCSAVVTVSDTTPPVITCPGDLTFECDAVGAFGSPTATDICDANPTINLFQRDSTPGDCPQEYVLGLTYRAKDDAGNTSDCLQTITVQDTTPPEITCPDTVHIVFTSPTEATVEFTVTATDNCADSVETTCDSASGGIFAIGHHTVSCVADDGCGNTDSCSFSFLLVPLDIHPGSCPNPLNVKSKGGSAPNYTWKNLVHAAGASPDEARFPVAILGRADIDVTQIDPESVKLAGVSSLMWHYKDVSGPVANDPSQGCECTQAGPDGFTDLVINFDRQALIAALGPLTNGQVFILQVSGTLIDGTQFAGGDCIVVRASKNGTSSVDEEDAPNEFSLTTYPNPFNAATTVSYALPADGHVSLTVFNVLGQRVRTLVNESQPAGQHDVVWDCRTANGAAVASGIYFYRLEVGPTVLTRKMLLLK